jgi:hypothetical protein
MSGLMDLELSHQHREEIMQEVAVARLARLRARATTKGNPARHRTWGGSLHATRGF